MPHLFEQCVTRIKAELELMGESGLNVAPYRLAQSELTIARRIVLVPESYVYKGMQETGPRRATDGKIYSSVLRETWTIECRILGSSFEDAEALRRKLIVICKQLFRTSCRFVGGTFVTQAFDDARLIHAGTELVVQRMEWDLDQLVEAPRALIQSVTTTAGEDTITQEG
jgi:hypothetical protein